MSLAGADLLYQPKAAYSVSEIFLDGQSIHQAFEWHDHIVSLLTEFPEPAKVDEQLLMTRYKLLNLLIDLSVSFLSQ